MLIEDYMKKFGIKQMRQVDLKEFLMNYHAYDELSANEKQKIDLLLGVVSDINNVKIDRRKEAFDSLNKAGKYFQNRIGFKSNEHFEIALLDRELKLIKSKTLFKGAINYTVSSPREVLKEVLQTPDTKYVVSAHNHPGGIDMPSINDASIVHNLNHVLKMVGVEHLSSVIATDHSYFPVAPDHNYFDKVVKEKSDRKPKEKRIFLSAEAAKEMSRRDFSVLNLEEKLGALTGIEPSRLKDVFYSKSIGRLDLSDKEKEAIKMIQDFAKEIRNTLDYRYKHRGSIISPGVVLGCSEQYIDPIKPEQVNVIFMDSSNLEMKSEIFSKPQSMNALAAKIGKKAIVYNAPKCVIVHKDEKVAGLEDCVDARRKEMRSLQDLLGYMEVEVMNQLVVDDKYAFSYKTAEMSKRPVKEANKAYEKSISDQLKQFKEKNNNLGQLPTKKVKEQVR